ncbi:MAG: hypothetical protein LM522_11865 [Candidatus Contendobacter sp.]|nr:hypothetical protein [Candidatus Contendobacter sp.]
MSEPRRILASKARRRTPTRRQTPHGKIESDEDAESDAPGAINRAQFDALNPDDRMDFAISNRCVFDAKTDPT